MWENADQSNCEYGHFLRSELHLVYKNKAFNKYIFDFEKNSETLNSIFASKSLLPLQLTLLSENSLANCHFSKNDILQVIRIKLE